MLHLCRTKK